LIHSLAFISISLCAGEREVTSKRRNHEIFNSKNENAKERSKTLVIKNVYS
jgi:hypothetical protein